MRSASLMIGELTLVTCYCYSSISSCVILRPISVVYPAISSKAATFSILPRICVPYRSEHGVEDLTSNTMLFRTFYYYMP